MELFLEIVAILGFAISVGAFSYKKGFINGGKYAILQVRKALAEDTDENIFGTGSKNFINKV